MRRGQDPSPATPTRKVLADSDDDPDATPVPRRVLRPSTKRAPPVQTSRSGRVVSSSATTTKAVLPTAEMQVSDLPELSKPNGEIKTIYDLLYTQLPQAPRIYKKGLLRSTRDVSKADSELSRNASTFEQLVYAPDMLAPLISAAQDRLREKIIDWSHEDTRSLVVHLHPYHTTRKLPPVLFSEKDTERWFMEVILQPALALLRADVHPYNQEYMTESEEHPYVASCPHDTSSVSDFIFVSDEPEKETYTVAATLEIKVHSIWGKAFYRSNDDDLFLPLQNGKSGSTMAFRWPQYSGALKNDHRTRLLVQVWAQMVRHDTDMAMLSSYAGTMFFYRDRESHTLYFSNTFTNRDAVIFATYAWLLEAFKRQDRDYCLSNPLDLPEPSTEHWRPRTKGEMRAEFQGVLPWTIPPAIDPSLTTITSKNARALNDRQPGPFLVPE